MVPAEPLPGLEQAWPDARHADTGPVMMTALGALVEAEVHSVRTCHGYFVKFSLINYNKKCSNKLIRSAWYIQPTCLLDYLTGIMGGGGWGLFQHGRSILLRR